MNKIIIIFFLLLSITSYGKSTYKIKVNNGSEYTKYVLIKYKNRHNEFVQKEVVLRKHHSFRVKSHSKKIYLFSISFHEGGKTYFEVSGNDGVGFMYEYLMGRQANYKKIYCDNKTILII